MACIHSLPNELLTNIFLLSTMHDSGYADGSLAPMILSHVCHRWRQVSLSFCPLWTRIIMTYPNTATQFSRIAAWLLRSGECPLQLFLDFRDPDWIYGEWEEDTHNVGQQEVGAALRLLLPHVLRWKEVEFLSDTWAPINAFLINTRYIESAPALESLSLSRCNAYYAQEGVTFEPSLLWNPVPLFDGRLTSLRQLVLSGVHIHWSGSRLSNLISLVFEYHAFNVMPSLAEFIDILRASPHLKSLSIIGWGPKLYRGAAGWINSIQLSARRSVRLAHLTDFSFGFINVDYAVELLSLFNFPSLQVLSIEDVSAGLNPNDSRDSGPLFTFLSMPHTTRCPSRPHTSACDSLTCFPLRSIHTLKLQCICASRPSIAAFISRLSFVKRLSLFGVDNGLLEALKPTLHDVPLPHLSHVSCRGIDHSILLDILASRFRNGFTFHKISLEIQDGT